MKSQTQYSELEKQLLANLFVAGSTSRRRSRYGMVGCVLFGVALVMVFVSYLINR